VRLVPPSPALETGGVRLRTFDAADAPAIAEACADPDIGRFTFMKQGQTEADARAWIAERTTLWDQGVARFAIEDAQLHTFLGQVGLETRDEYRSGELFYWVVAPGRGNAVAPNAVALVCDWAFGIGVERIALLTHVDNHASQRVAVKCGFTREGVLRAYVPFKGSRPDLVSWSLLPSDRRPWHT